MAQILCSLSGILFQCEHMPLSLHSREYHHPLFSLPKKRLLGLTSKWSAGQLSVTESYLLYLSLFNSTELIDWRVPATFTSKTPQIIATNMESLISVVGKIDLINHPSFTLPRFVITSDTCDLTNTYHWIQIWLETIHDWYDGLRESSARESLKHKLEIRESSLQKLIKTAHTTPELLANSLASWAEVAANFPDMRITHPLTKSPSTLSEYWKQIIRACAKDEAIWQFPEKHINELIEHCEDELTLEERTSEVHGHGSIYAYSLMKLLRNGLSKKANYLDFGNADLGGRVTSFKILSESTSIGDANMIAAIQSAPTEAPRREQYKTPFEFLKAKANWDLKQRYKKDGE